MINFASQRNVLIDKINDIMALLGIYEGFAQGWRDTDGPRLYGAVFVIDKFAKEVLTKTTPVISGWDHILSSG